MLYDYLPAVYKNKDAEQGYPLASLVAVEAAVLDKTTAAIAKLEDQKDLLTAQLPSTGAKTIQLGAVVKPVGALLQGGLRGYFNTAMIGANFGDPGAVFGASMVGCTLAVKGVTIASNAREFTIVAVPSPRSLLLTPVPTNETGFRWELRAVPKDKSFGTKIEVYSCPTLSDVAPGWQLLPDTGSGESYKIASRSIIAGPTEREGHDATIDAQGRLVLGADRFTTSDIGKRIVTYGSSNPNNNVESYIRNIFRKTPDLAQTDPYKLASLTNTLVLDSGPVSYAISERPTIELDGNCDNVSGVVVLSGDDGQVTTTTFGTGYGTLKIGDAVLDADVFSATVSVSTIFNGVATLVGLTGVTTAVIGRLIHLTSGIFVHIGWFEIKNVLSNTSLQCSIVSSDPLDPNLTAPSGPYWGSIASSLVGYDLVLRGSLVNDYNATVLGVGSTQEMYFYPANYPINEETLEYSPLIHWELRKKNKASVAPRSLLTTLAADEGVTVAPGLTDERSRRWVEGVRDWAPVKGALSAYYDVLDLCRYDYTGGTLGIYPLYSVPLDMETLLGGIGVNMFERPVISEGRPGAISGTGGTFLTNPTTGEAAFALGIGALVASGTHLLPNPVPFNQSILASLPDVFAFGDEDSYIRISGAATPGNNTTLHRIKAVPAWNSSVPQRFYVTLTDVPAAVNDANNGSLSWSIVRLYTAKPPRRPRFDDMAPELMATLVGAGPATFGIDRFEWETTFSATTKSGLFSITAVTLISDNRYTLQITGNTIAGPITGDLGVVLDVTGGNWSLKTLTATYYLETLPVSTGASVWTVEVVYGVLPVNEAADLVYKCPLLLSDTYAPSNRILVNVHAASGACSSDILSQRLVEITPAHVTLDLIIS